MSRRPFILATRGSPLALAQANQVLASCQAAFPREIFQIKIVKTTGDKLQSLSVSQNDPALPKGLFTKELENTLLNGTADIAVHSLKDLPTELPQNLKLAAVGPREDIRDVLITRATHRKAALGLQTLPPRATVATGSIRRKAQLEAMRSDLQIVPIRGNVGTRLRKLAEAKDLDGLILAAAGMARLSYKFARNGSLKGPDVPAGLCATLLSLDEMLPCVGQGAIGLETRYLHA